MWLALQSKSVVLVADTIQFLAVEATLPPV